MISRIWHGWTTRENADAYEALLRHEIFAGIVARRIDGFHDIDLLRRDHAHEVEFVTIMRFASLGAVQAFAGADHETAVVPPAARALLSRLDARSAHYEVRERCTNAGASHAATPLSLELGVFLVAVVLGSLGGVATSMLLGRWLAPATAATAALAVATTCTGAAHSHFVHRQSWAHLIPKVGVGAPLAYGVMRVVHALVGA